MKAGDLVIMPGESIPSGEPISIGLIVDDRSDLGIHGKTRRVGVMWNDSLVVDWEPADWLEVVKESE